MNVERITANEFISTAWPKSPVIVDLRTPAEINVEYIDGCFCLPVQTLTSAQLNNTLIENNKMGESVYLLCQSGLRADLAIKKLAGEEDSHYIIIDGGLNALKAAGMDIEKGSSNLISLERQVRIAAGALTVIGVVLGTFVNPYFYGLSAFVGAGLMFAGITNTCGMALALAKMPWNK